jgi:transposase InsO family protein
VPRRSSRPSSTADPADDRLHRRHQEPVRGRADLPGAADRPVRLLRRQAQAALGQGAARRGVEARDRPGPPGQLGGLWRPQDLAAAAPRRHLGGPLHRRAADGELGLQGVRRGKAGRTTTPDQSTARPADLVGRDFSAARPNQLWVADLPWVATWSGVVDVAFILDAFSRFILGWQAAWSLRTDLALAALEMAIWQRHGAWMGWCTTPTVSMWGPGAPGRPDPHSDGRARIHGAGTLPGVLTHISD